MIRIIYPEDRMVSEETIISWYLDRVADGQIEEHTDDVREMAALLEDIGVITVGS